MILEEPLSALLAKTTDNFGNDRAFNGGKVRVDKFEVVPAVNNRQIQFKFTTKTTGEAYETMLVFDDVEYVTEPTETSVTVKAVDGSDYHVEPLAHDKSDVRVRCTCLDFYYRFASHNKTSNSLHGDAPPPYVKKTNRAPVNPNKVSGNCKHILAAVDYIGNLNLIN